MRSVIFHMEDFFLVPFTLVWGGGALYWEALVVGYPDLHNQNDVPWFFIAWGIPFLLIGQ